MMNFPTGLPAPPMQPSFPGMGPMSPMGGPMGPGGMGGGMMPQMAQTPQSLPLSTLVTSPLDRYSLKNYGKLADMLSEDELPSLYDYVLRTAEQLKTYWKPRDDRMLDSQSFWEIGTRYAEENYQRNRAAKTVEGQHEDQEGETFELNDGYLTADKITSMVSGANWALDVPPARVGLEDVAQDIESMLVWADEQLDRKYSFGLHGTTLRDEVHYAVLRGWITGMVVPNPDDPYLPWTYLLEDPLLVYPRYAGEDLSQVCHCYTMNVLEAQAKYDMAFDFLLEKDDDDEVEVVEYHDQIYRLTLLVDGGMVHGLPYSGDRVTLLPLTRHSYVDHQGKPINPWIIVTPRGTPTRRFSNASTSSTQEATAYIGLDVLHPIKHIIIAFERLMAMLLTEIAKGVNPPRIMFYDGFNKPEELDIGVGSTNWLILGSQDARIIESTAMKPDANPVLSIIEDRMQKGSVPAVLFGNVGQTLAGYAINLLSQGAQDVVQPLTSGVKRYRELKFQRMLEMYLSIGHTFAGPIAFGATDPSTGIKYASGKYIDPQTIHMNGVKVDVTFDTVTPRDAVPLMTAAVAANQAGILPLYDAMKDYAGIKDPKAAMRRLAEGMNYNDPRVQKHLARKAGLQSGNKDLQEAVLAAIYEEQMMMMQAMAAQGMGGEGGGPNSEGSPKGPPSLPGGEEGPGSEASPPASINPITAATQQANNVSAAMNVRNGGSPPNPLADFLGMNGGR